MKKPLLLISLVAGILCRMIARDFFPSAEGESFLWAFLPGLVGCALAIFMLAGTQNAIRRNPLKAVGRRRRNILWAALLFASLGMITCVSHEKSLPPLENNCNYHFHGRILEHATTRGEHYTLRLDDGRKLLLFSESARPLRPGDIVQLTGTFRQWSNSTTNSAINSATNSTSNSTSNSSENSFSHSAAGMIICQKGEMIFQEGHSEDIFSLAWRAREAVKVKIENCGCSGESVALMKALFLGERSGLTMADNEAFRDAGVSHMLALSGMHLGLIYLLLLFLTRPLVFLPYGYGNGRTLRYLIVMLGIWVFAFLTGLSNSSLRAALMLSVLLMARIMQRSRSSFDALCVAGIVILLISPDALTDIGFQLSFASVAALILLVEPLNPVRHHEHPHTFKVCSILLTTLIATAATWPLCGLYFGSISTFFLPSNLLLLPLLPIYMLLGGTHLLLSAIGCELEWLVFMADAGPLYMYQYLDGLRRTSVLVEVGYIEMILWFCGMLLLALSFHLQPKDAFDNPLRPPQLVFPDQIPASAPRLSITLAPLIKLPPLTYRPLATLVPDRLHVDHLLRILGILLMLLSIIFTTLDSPILPLS